MLYLLDDTPSEMPFPDPEQAETEPDGLLAIGGDLSVPRLLNAYRQGIFPWFSAEQPIMWWSPDPRMVMFPASLHVSRSLAKLMRKGHFQITCNQAFSQVIRNCAVSRRDGEGTWLTPEMIAAYEALHQQGVAHSVECWCNGELAGGLYGNLLGAAFFGESMFAKVDNASKVAFVSLVRELRERGCQLIDCQVYTRHLASLGAELISRRRFLKLLTMALQQKPLKFPTTC